MPPVSLSPPTIATDYDFRGQSQTNPDQDGFDPTFQLGANYEFDSGFYAGIWGSNVDFGAGKPSVEIDYTVGFAGGDAAESFGYDFGVTYYSYPGAGDLNSAEFYAGISKGWFSGKLWYSDNYQSSGDSSYYIEGNASIPVPAVEGLSVLAHLGLADGDAFSNSFTDYSVGVGYDIGKFSTTLKYIDGDTKGGFEFDNRVVLAISTTLPWAE